MGLGFGIVGTGMISRFHVKAIADIEGAEFVACCTGLPDYVEGAHQLVEGTVATAHASLEEMLADPKVDVVTICTPSGCLLYTSPSPRDRTRSRMPSSA